MKILFISLLSGLGNTTGFDGMSGGDRIHINLIKNTSKIINYHNLLPELNTVDFLVKINSEARLINEKMILNSIQQIPQVVTCYKVESNDIVSNENLIF